MQRRHHWAPALSFASIILTIAGAPAVRAEEAPSEKRAANDAAAASTLHFENDVLPVLTRYGCNSGGCHGRANGQNGFKLSLFGFDPQADYAAVAEDGLGRRVSWTAPAESLLLRKASGQVPHGGGVRFEADSPSYQLIAKWIEAGTPWGASDAPTLSGINVDPASRVVASGETGKLTVTARYSDGSTRDVTSTAEFFNQDLARLAVTPEGSVKSLGVPGEATVAVRYMGVVAISRWLLPHQTTVPEDKYAPFAPAGFIDQHVLARWKKLGIAPGPQASDAEFLRRIYLDAIGTLPTPAEIREYLGDASADKRERLIDKLLERPEYASFWAQKWGDILRNRQGDAAQKEFSVKFTEWLRKAMAENMPYDKFARSLIAATGKIEDEPQMDWYRQINSPQTRVEDTSQVFLGTRVSCANCHNHPFERISQDDYWRFAAFYARIDAMSYGTVKTVKIKDEGTVSNPRTGQEMSPRTFNGFEVAYVKGEDPRQKLVDWLVAKENPYFARTLVNRLWAHYMKRGLVDPVDDHRATNPATNPELLDALASSFAGNAPATPASPPAPPGGIRPFDIKSLTREILRSQAYSLSSQPVPDNAADTQNYARHYPQRLAPHVLLDAIDAATGNKTKFQQFPDIPRAIQLPNESEQNDFLEIFGRSKRDTPCTCETRLEPNLSQTLFLLFSPELQKAIAQPEGTVAHLLKTEKPTNELVDELYLLALSRFPTEAERRDAAQYIDTTMPKKAAAEDILWTLLNSKEFLFNH